MWDQDANFVESGADVQTFLRELHEESEILVEEGIIEKGWEPERD
jgi:hypothetical protein